MPVEYIPEGYHTVTPYLTVQGAEKLITFLKNAFDAKERDEGFGITRREDGTIGNAELQVGDSIILLSDARDEWPPTPFSFYLYVSDTDAVYKKAIAAGGISVMEPADMFYGDRNAGVKDAFGNHWWIATHIEDVSQKELQKRSNNQGK